ncbi:MAG: CD225/dispanin family protein [Ferruginibacter sp.]|nr:CD225/dispanin family protein [Cytophagales bacterium]
MEQNLSGQTGQTPPKNWLVESILVTIFCCLPFGIVGIINAAAVNTKVAAGDFTGAAKSSQEAGKWTKIGFFAGIVVIVLYFVVVVMLGVGGTMFNRPE